jgi:hypothetical protein
LHVAAALLVSVVRGGHQQEAGPGADGHVLLRQVRRKFGLSVTVRHVDGSALVCRRGHFARKFASARISIPNGLGAPPLFHQIHLLNLCMKHIFFPHQKTFGKNTGTEFGSVTLINNPKRVFCD